MGELEPLVAASRLPYRVRSLRTHELRRFAEARHAALFAFGMSRRLPEFVFDFALAEHDDYDAVIRWRNAKEQIFTPVQLKELVPAKLNRAATLSDIIAICEKYKVSSDLTVSIYLNRRMRLELTSLPVPRTKLGGLYIIAAANYNRRYWHLIGNLLDETCERTVFEHP
jgi:hypothetical protein